MSPSELADFLAVTINVCIAFAFVWVIIEIWFS